jgi:hypothetical protein
MNIYVGKFYKGDNKRALKLEILDEAGVGWGTIAATGYVPTLEVREPGAATLTDTLVGVWEDVSEKAALFVLGNIPSLYPLTDNTSRSWEALLVLSNFDTAKFGSGSSGDRFLFDIVG